MGSRAAGGHDVFAMPPRYRVVPNELIDDIFTRATFSPNELDLDCDALTAAELRLTRPGVMPADLGLAIQTRGSISCLTKLHSEAWEPVLYRTIVIHSDTQLDQVYYALTKNAARQAHVQQINIDYEMGLKCIHELLVLTPKVRRLTITGYGQGKYSYALPELEYCRMAGELRVWPQAMRGQNIRILDLSAITLKTLRNAPLLPHLYAVGVRLDQWVTFIELWLVNRAGIEMLFLKWSTPEDNPAEIEEVREQWRVLLPVAARPILPNLTHFITSLLPPYDCSMVFPRLHEMQILYDGYDFDTFVGVNPFDGDLAGWATPPKFVKLTNIPGKFELTRGLKDETDSFWRYHRDLKDFIETHEQLYSMTKTDGRAMTLLSESGELLEHKTLQKLWKKHLGNDLANVQDPENNDRDGKQSHNGPHPISRFPTPRTQPLGQSTSSTSGSRLPCVGFFKSWLVHSFHIVPHIRTLFLSVVFYSFIDPCIRLTKLRVKPGLRPISCAYKELRLQEADR